MFVLPNLASGHLPEETQNPQVLAREMIKADTITAEQPYFVRFDSPIIPYQSLQAVVFCEYLTTSYRLIITHTPPIRAGPLHG